MKKKREFDCAKKKKREYKNKRKESTQRRGKHEHTHTGLERPLDMFKGQTASDTERLFLGPLPLIIPFSLFCFCFSYSYNNH